MVRPPNQTAENILRMRPMCGCSASINARPKPHHPFSEGRPEILQPGGIFHGPSLGRARVCAHENEKTVLAMTPSCQSRLLPEGPELSHPPYPPRYWLDARESFFPTQRR